MYVCMCVYARVHEVSDVVLALYCQVKFMCALSQNSLQLANRIVSNGFFIYKESGDIVRLIKNIYVHI